MNYFFQNRQNISFTLFAGVTLVLNLSSPPSLLGQVIQPLRKLSTEQSDQTNQKQIPIATTIEGIVKTPIIWTDNSQPQDTRATIVLNKPLLYEDGEIALPKDSAIIVEVSDWDDAGFVTLNAIAIVYKNEQGEFRQSELPKGSLLVRDTDNQPLAFKTKKSSNGNSLVRDLLGEAAETGTRNLPVPGRVGSSLSRTVRNNFRRSRRSSGEEVYSVKQETEVSIYVNSFLSIED